MSCHPPARQVGPYQSEDGPHDEPTEQPALADLHVKPYAERHMKVYADTWYRWATLALLAHAFLVVAALTERTCHPPPSGLIPLTCNELQRLFAALLARPAADSTYRLHWSLWRRRHQARARACHYRRQANGP